MHFDIDNGRMYVVQFLTIFERDACMCRRKQMLEQKMLVGVTVHARFPFECYNNQEEAFQNHCHQYS